MTTTKITGIRNLSIVSMQGERIEIPTSTVDWDDTEQYALYAYDELDQEYVLYSFFPADIVVDPQNSTHAHPVAEGE